MTGPGVYISIKESISVCIRCYLKMTTTISSDDVEVKDESGIDVTVAAEELSAIGSHVNDASLKFMNNDFRKLLNSHAVAFDLWVKTAF